ncbi:polyprenyl synthetase family protein [Nocardioides sp. HM23]|uniref:polyprenyl synthetase family protein n=1 Tax=Nocardioides bizhenqiangii TaxID=3095076 RepID=UPI002ACA031D|nr:polyprenyl synthetase family protein [Nocardioides sp. HM23]MDZ5620667.1 polyprenyl synthetase family protein [Nocardioides sp. HM23]
MTGQAWDQGDQQQFRTDLQAAIDGFLDEQAARLAPLGDDAARLVAEGRAVVSGGKRFRAAFCYWGFRAAAREQYDERTILRAAASLELLHASALVHDDLMDASDTRRGRPATHRGFAELHRDQTWPGDPQQYGAAAAILLGDLLLSWSDELLRRCGMPFDRVGPALDVLDTCRSEVIAGQFLDVSVQARGRATVEDAMTVLRYKSAKYSIERPLHVGAALAGASPDALAALTGYGLPLGEAFQLRDDLLGVFGDPATTGKPAGDDLVEGKRTVLVALALEGAPAADAARLDAALGTTLGEEEVAELRGIIDRSGAHAQVEEKIDDLAQRAVTALAEARSAVGLDEHACAVLEGLASSATRRAL